MIERVARHSDVEIHTRLKFVRDRFSSLANGDGGAVSLAWTGRSDPEALEAVVCILRS